MRRVEDFNVAPDFHLASVPQSLGRRKERSERTSDGAYHPVWTHETSEGRFTAVNGDHVRLGRVGWTPHDLGRFQTRRP